MLNVAVVSAAFSCGLPVLMLAVPLILLYELSLVAMWFTDRRAMKEAALPQNNQAGSDPA